MSDRFAIYPSLVDKVVFVTGGGSGIGASIVEHFCAQRSNVTFVDIDAAASAELCAQIGPAGARTPRFVHCDLRDIALLQTIVSSVGKASGPITALVNNAANDDRHKTQDVTVDYWNDRIAVNLRHQFFASQAVYPQMKSAGGGSIINFGSISWMAAQAGIPVYTAAKAATHGMTRSFARELGQYNIRVNTVVPGWVMTKRQLDLWVDDAANELIDRSQCLAGRVQPQDIAAMVTFLASDNARMCSAQNYVVDGGWV